MTAGYSIGVLSRVAAAALLVATSAAVARGGALENVTLRRGVYTLAAGPNIEGVAFLHGAAWPITSSRPSISGGPRRMAFSTSGRGWRRTGGSGTCGRGRSDRCSAGAARRAGCRRFASTRTCRARLRTAAGPWSDWADGARVQDLPPGSNVEVEVRLHTDDGYFSPKVRAVSPVWASSQGASQRPGRERIVSPSRRDVQKQPSDTDVAALICGTWALQQVSSLAELKRLRAGVIEAALATPHLRGFSLRVPWKAIDQDFSLLDAGRRIARRRELAFSVRFMAGRHTPKRVFDNRCRCYLRRGQPVPAPFLADGSPNVVFEKAYGEFVARLARWCRKNGVRLLHLAWYGQDWAELNHGREVRALAGYSFANWLRAHKRLLDIGLAHADETLAVELPFSGYGPLTEAAVALADHVVAKAGPSKATFFCQANGWGRAGEWGAPNARTEAAFDRVWARPICRGLQAIQPRDFDWAAMYRKLYACKATYCEVYAPSFTQKSKDQLAGEIAKFARHCAKAPLRPARQSAPARQ